MKGLKETFILIKFNALSIFMYELIMRIISYSVLIPALYTLVNFSVKFSGVKYLYKSNLSKFFHSPMTYIFFGLIILIYAFALVLNIVGVIIAIDASRRKERISSVELFFRSLIRTSALLRPRNFPVLIAAVFLLPISSIAFMSLSLLNVQIPSYIVVYFMKKKVMMNVIMIVYASLSLLSFGLIYILHSYALGKKRFKKAAVDSLRLLRVGGIKKVIGILIFNLLVVLLIFFLSGSLSELSYRFLKVTSDKKSVNYLLYLATVNVNKLLYIPMALFTFPMIFGYISVKYYQVTEEHPHVLTPPEKKHRIIHKLNEKDEAWREKRIARRHRRREKSFRNDPEKNRLYRRAVLTMVMLIFLVLDAAYYILVRVNIVSLNAAHLRTAVVTAHRGDSKHAPENTLAAFDLAIKNGADVIELDVRETKDGKIIVTHDKNLKRTTGIDAYVEDLTYGEIRQFDAGSWFSEEYKGEQIPTLREAIELIKGRAKLNIELKPDVQNKHLEESVAELIEEYDLYKKCVVTSLNYKSIKKIKEIDSRIETVYVMSAAGGNYYDLKYADNYSINYRFIDDQVMRNCKQRGKEVYAWTVNSSEELESVMMVGVDNVITDDPGFVKDSMYESYNNGLFSYLVARLAFK